MTADDSEHEQRVNIQTLTTFGIAIILHSFIDGLAIGVFDEVGSIAILATSVIIHRIPVACSVGTTFKTNDQPISGPCTIIVFWIFILASPIGMLCGMLLSKVETGLGLVIIQSMSGGTFVYLACCDLLVHEFSGHGPEDEPKYEKVRQAEKDKQQEEEISYLIYLKYLMMLIGSIIVITLVGIAPAHEH